MTRLPHDEDSLSDYLIRYHKQKTSVMKTPDQIKEHSDKYEDGSWKKYTPEQLSHWVVNFGIRATHRTDPEKSAKDIQDARNYLSMLEAWLDSQEQKSESQ